MRRLPPLVGFVGPSGIGKTTLLCRVLAALEARGVEAGAVKHSCHAVEADRPGKDSHLLYDAGAAAVALAMPGQVAVFRRTTARRPRLVEALAGLPPDLDVVLVEGFAWEPIPRYVLLPPDGRDERGDVEAGTVLRVIHAPPAPPDGPPLFDAALVRELVREIMSLSAREPARPAGSHAPASQIQIR
jgi:molybdopterin-guanine dinucleotide biosynthesis protein B